MRPFLFRAFRRLETKVHELNYLFWECTQRCNLSCRHCGSDCFVSAKDQDMPLDDFLRALDTIPNTHQKFTVVLTGGEPLLRPDIDKVGKEIRRRGYNWSMVSNGFFYTEEMHRRLMGAGMNALTISLDGIGEAHNWMRGNPKSYENALKAISIAAKEKYLDFDVVSCINKRSLPQMEEIYTVLSGLGVKRWRIFTIIPIGRAVQDPDLHLSNEEMVRLMDFIAAKRRQKTPMEVTFSCEGYLGKYEEKVRPVRYFCHAGINIASVLIDGRICACPNIDRDVFSQGNIYTDNLYEVWENKFQVFRNRNWAHKGICAGCKQFKNCLGGGMHNWRGDCSQVLSCHYRRTGNQ